MRFWQTLSFCEQEQLEEVAQYAEKVGFTGVAFSEHLVTEQQQSQPYDYTDDGQVLWDPETPWPDPWIQSVALAKVTDRLQFLTSVYVLPMRDPFTAAKSIGTAACIAPGRINLGVGVGWQALEFELVDRSFKNRGKRVDEQLEIMKKLWQGGMVSYSGDYHRFGPLQMSPTPPQPIPVWVGGHSAPALKRAVHHDGWIGACYELEELEALVASLKMARLETGQSLDGFRIAAGLFEPSREQMQRLVAIGLTDYIKPSWMKDRRAAKSPLAYKQRELSHFVEEFGEFFD